MSDIQRYYIQCWSMSKRENGNWVKYDDHRAEVERLKALIICLSRPIDGDSAWVLEDEENEAITAIWQEKQEREQREAAAKGVRDE